MNKFKDRIAKLIRDLPISTLLWILVIITAFGFLSLFYAPECLISKVYGALDSASAVALAVLGFFGYRKYIQEQQDKNRQIENLRVLGKRRVQDSEIALLIQFGGKGDMTISMKEFLKTIDFPGEVIISDSFGDTNNQVNVEDIEKLKIYCQNVKGNLALASKVHIFYGGLTVGYAVIADILSNTTSLAFYHKNNKKYELWYEDSKSEEKEIPKMEPKH